VFRHPELKYVINELDFNNWIFRNEQRDGVYELAKELNNFADDGFHPGSATYKQWAEFVNTKI
jgi:lysophospholipase L1-like esterase